MSYTPPKRLSAALSFFGDDGKLLLTSFHFPFSAADLNMSPAIIHLQFQLLSQ